MIDEPLPKQADLRKLAGREAQFHVHSDFSAFTRFQQAVVDEKGLCQADIALALDEQHRICITGQLLCQAEVACQRCLESVAIEFRSDINLMVVRDDTQAKNLNRLYDPLVVEDETAFDLNEMLEDELLLAMPFASYHEKDQCKGSSSYQSGPEVEVVVEEKENPFSVLANFKADK